MEQGPRILSTRIDNRLVHGQVGITWTKTLGANLILVADDETAYEILQQKLMAAVARNSGAQIRFFTLTYTAKVICNASVDQKIFMVIKNLSSARKLVELGVPLTSINIGNLHFEHGKKMLTKKVYVDDQDINDIQYLLDSGIDVYIQEVPGDTVIPVKEVL